MAKTGLSQSACYCGSWSSDEGHHWI